MNKCKARWKHGGEVVECRLPRGHFGLCESETRGQRQIDTYAIRPLLDTTENPIGLTLRAPNPQRDEAQTSRQGNEGS